MNTMSARRLFDILFDELNAAKEAHYEDHSKPYPGEPGGLITEGYAELRQDLRFADGGFLKQFTTLRIVFVSCMGDFGVTPNLAKKTGYDFRIPANDALLMNCRRTLKLEENMP